MGFHGNSASRIPNLWRGWWGGCPGTHWLVRGQVPGPCFPAVGGLPLPRILCYRVAVRRWAICVSGALRCRWGDLRRLAGAEATEQQCSRQDCVLEVRDVEGLVGAVGAGIGSSTPVTRICACGKTSFRSEMNGMEPPMPVCTGSRSQAARIASRAVCAPSASTSVEKGIPESTAV